MTKPFRVLLYYKYANIDNPRAYTAEHLAFCKELGLKGRIFVSDEGINGTVSGTAEKTERYMDALKSDPRFDGIEFKVDVADDHVFKKMFVRYKPELVSLRLNEDINPNELTGKHLEPKEFLEAMQDDDVIIIDARNDYEHQIGHFRNALLPNIHAFRDLPKWIQENLAGKKDKKILTYCTGGIRCEKFTGYLLKEGFKDVSQLHGGIVEYGKDLDVKGKYYDGKCYVFDSRISVSVNRTKEDVIVGQCYHCGKAEDRLVNCANPECNLQHICCEACEVKHERSCSKECREHPHNRYRMTQNV